MTPVVSSDTIARLMRGVSHWGPAGIASARAALSDREPAGSGRMGRESYSKRPSASDSRFANDPGATASPARVRASVTSGAS